MQTSIANSATTTNLSACIVMSIANVWKLLGPLKATDMFTYAYVASKTPLLFLVSPQPTSSVSARLTTVPRSAAEAADRLVRMLEMARTNQTIGETMSAGTAQGSVVDGLKLPNRPDDLAPDAAPDAAAKMSPAWAS